MLAAIVFEGGDAFGHGRFVAPLLPLIYFSGLAGLATLLKRMSLQTAQSALVVALVLGSGGLLLLRASNNPFIPIDREDHEERRALGAWMNEHTPPDYTIAAFAVGAVGYYAHDRAVLDMLGLNDEVIAHSDIPNFGIGIAGHEKYNVDYVLDQVQPEIIIRGDADAGPLTNEELKQTASRRGSPVEAANVLLNDPRLWERYEVQPLRIGKRWFNFLQRKDTIGELQGPGLLK